MEAVSTKQRILEQALLLFSQKGFDAVSVEQIASAVGIKAPSLYKHYRSKQAIFDAIFAEMRQRYDKQTEEMQLHLENADRDYTSFTDMTAEVLYERVGELIAYSLHEPFVSRFRRLMTLEQFRSPELAALYTERYVTRILRYHEKLFEALLERGVLNGTDARAMAWQYISPVMVILSICDRQPEREEEMMQQLKAHITQFHAVYQCSTGESCHTKTKGGYIG